MGALDIFDGLMEDSPKKILFNTGTLFDLMTGSYEIGVNGQYFLNGGMGPFIHGLHGRGNMYKSTITDSFEAGIIRAYPDAAMFNFDTEYSKSKDRMASYLAGGLFPEQDIAPRIVLKSHPEWTTEKVWTFVKDICERRQKAHKSIMITTPFLDPGLVPLQVLSPVIVAIDSLSELHTGAMAEFMEKQGFEDKKFRTLYMEDGNKKTILMGMLNEYSSKYGVIVVCTGRTGNNMSMDNAPPRKELLYQKQADKIKDVGAKFTTLTHILSQVMSCRPCIDSSKEAEYPFGDTSAEDLHEVQIIISRNKMNTSGCMVPFVVSQKYGLLNDVSNFHFLKYHGSNGAAPGMLGGGRSQFSCSWLPDVKFSRKNLREKTMGDYKLCRAIELVARYQYIKMSWNLTGQPVDFSNTAEQVFDKLTSAKADMDDILETTSIWNPSPKGSKVKKGATIEGAQGRRFMSLFDILGLIS